MMIDDWVMNDSEEGCWLLATGCWLLATGF
jgi:hypothetical protein